MLRPPGLALRSLAAKLLIGRNALDTHVSVEGRIDGQGDRLNMGQQDGDGQAGHQNPDQDAEDGRKSLGPAPAVCSLLS